MKSRTKVLFYSEPTILVGQTEKNEELIHAFDDALISTLSLMPDAYELTVVYNDIVALPRTIKQNATIVSLSTDELTRTGTLNPQTLLLGWTSDTYSQEALEYYKALFRSKIMDPPDIIFTVFEVPFLRAIFPDALFLSLSVGLLSRVPFGHSNIYSPFFMPSAFSGYPDKYWNAIERRLTLKDYETNLMEKFKERARDLFLQTSPFRHLLCSYRKKHRYLYLFPLSIPHNFFTASPEKHCPEFYFLIHTLERIQASVGVLVTMHGRCTDLISQRLMASLQEKYSNLLFDETFLYYENVSQFLLPEIDGVICLCTSVGLQTMLYGKKLVVLGKDAFNCIKDADSIEMLNASLDTPAKDKTKPLFWYLIYYSIPRNYYKDPCWLDTFLSRSLKRFRNGEMTSFFDPIDEPMRILTNLIDSMNPHLPLLRHSYLENKIWRNRTQDDCVQLGGSALFTLGGDNNYRILSGFAMPEATHVWTNQPDAAILLPLPAMQEDLWLVLRGNLLSSEQVLSIRINGVDLRCVKSDGNNYVFLFPASMQSPDAKAVLSIHVDRLISPRSITQETMDERTLGFALKSVSFEPISAIA